MAPGAAGTQPEATASTAAPGRESPAAPRRMAGLRGRTSFRPVPRPAFYRPRLAGHGLRCSRYDLVNWHARSPVGGAPQGRQDSDLHAGTVLETAALPFELRPQVNENRPLGGLPAGGSWLRPGLFISGR